MLDYVFPVTTLWLKTEIFIVTVSQSCLQLLANDKRETYRKGTVLLLLRKRGIDV